MKTLIGAAILAVSSLCLAACAGDGAAPRDITIDLSTASAKVAAAPGDTLTVRFTENRSTGYMWERDAAPLPDGIVELSDEYVPDPVPQETDEDGNPIIMTGSGGTHVFTYRCERAAAGDLAYKFYPPGPREKADEERQLALTCR